MRACHSLGSIFGGSTFRLCSFDIDSLLLLTLFAFPSLLQATTPAPWTSGSSCGMRSRTTRLATCLSNASSSKVRAESFRLTVFACLLRVSASCPASALSVVALHVLELTYLLLPCTLHRRQVDESAQVHAHEPQVPACLGLQAAGVACWLSDGWRYFCVILYMLKRGRCHVLVSRDQTGIEMQSSDTS